MPLLLTATSWSRRCSTASMLSGNSQKEPAFPVCHSGTGGCFWALSVSSHHAHLHRATASSCSSCAGRIPPLPVPHSPGLRCALPPEGASSCPGPTLGAGSPHPLALSSLTPLWAQCVPRRSEQSSPAGRDRLTFLTSDPSDPLSSTTLSHQLETTHQTSFLWAPFAGLCCFAVTAHIAKEQSSLNM